MQNAKLNAESKINPPAPMKPPSKIKDFQGGKCGAENHYKT